MQPRTKIHKLVAPLQQLLPGITSKQEKWAYNKLDCYAAISRNRMFCLECNEKWHPGDKLLQDAEQPQKNGPDLTVKCPGCKRKLIVQRYNRDVYSTSCYWAVWTTFRDYQVIRILYVQKNMAKKKKPWWHTGENLQYWIGKDGAITLFSRTANYYYGGSSGFCGVMSLRPNGTEESKEYDIDLLDEYIYPVRKILPEITRNGFTGEFFGLSPHQMFAFLLNGVYGETLLKTGKMELFKYFAKNRRIISKKIWTALKICNRHKYKLKKDNISDWVDYVKLLIYFKKDIHNPVYVCPKDLHVEHNRLVQKKSRTDAQNALRKKAGDIEKEEGNYQKLVGKFFGVCFTDGSGLIITAMKSVRQVFEESTMLHHCAFTNNYHTKQNTLLLSATLDGVLLETIEVNTNTLKIIQARGLQNQASPHNRRIVELINSNMHLIQEIMQPRRRQPKKESNSTQSAA